MAIDYIYHWFSYTYMVFQHFPWEVTPNPNLHLGYLDFCALDKSTQNFKICDVIDYLFRILCCMKIEFGMTLGNLKKTAKTCFYP